MFTNFTAQVNKNTVLLSKFYYDGDSKRIKSENYDANGTTVTETILFIGSHYEVKNGSEITKYYFTGATRIAMRKYRIPQNMSVEYILGDHLGSSSITTNADGDKTSEVHYTPWGEVLSSWSASASLPIEYTFTGQMSYMDDPITSETTEGFGLMFFNARWLDPAIGRFAQADSIVPPGVQGYDRYAYVNNNPMRYTDPTGHMCSDPDDPTPSCDGSSGGGGGGGSGNGGGGGGSGNGGGGNDDSGDNPDLCQMYGEDCGGGSGGGSGGGGKPQFSPANDEICPDGGGIGSVCFYLSPQEMKDFYDYLVLQRKVESEKLKLSHLFLAV